MGEGWQLMRIRGIPLRVHPSWFLILALATLAFRDQLSELPASQLLSPGLTWLIGLVTALLLFLSVLLHELGHSLVALREGVKVRSITLFLLGGVASVERECSTAMGAFRVAAAGPLVSLVLSLMLFASGHSASHLNALLGNLVFQLAGVNLVLALFNLLPGLPLDGGLILKALVWQFTGSQRRGIQVATATGRFLSLFAIFLGVWLFLARGGGISALWLVMLGWFGLGASRSQTQVLMLQKVLRQLTVGSAMARRFRVLEADQPLRRMSELRLGGEAAGQGTDEADVRLADWVLVTRGGRWLGTIDDSPLRDLPVQQWDRQTVADHVQPLDSLPSIREAEPLWKAVLALDSSAQGRLLVINRAGLPGGTLERGDVGEAVLKALNLRLPPQMLEAARRQNGYPFGLPLLQAVESLQASGLLEDEPVGDKR
ncbi:site-2 protease family protein [Synechococcus sp. UW105]|uniref:site-2 protease family protein n=1 Tax=unclassified Synechococcus TaxID=2626047 RepID=UPI000E0F0EAD|nr:site-2 protease family protein [Synechococcus sp. UW105]RZO14915.1 MAG: site-2 protease family protein [Synechococcus sp. MED-G135]